MKVSLFVTCLVDQLFPQVAFSTIRVLERLGVQVDFDSRQTCCGQPAFNSGFCDEARTVAANLVDVFSESETIVVPSGSCAAMMRNYLPGLFEQGSERRAQAERVAQRTHELTDFLVNRLGRDKTGASLRETVAYHDSCHLLRELGVCEAPRKLLRNIDGLKLVELEDRQRCCGFGGTFSVKMDDVSAAIGRDKVEQIQRSGATTVVSSDVSCLMHLSGLMKRESVPVKALHIAELLAGSDD